MLGGIFNKCDQTECDTLGKSIAKALGTSGNLCTFTSGFLSGSCSAVSQCSAQEKKAVASAASAKSGKSSAAAKEKLNLSDVEQVEDGFCLVQDGDDVFCASGDECSGSPQVFKSEKLCEKFISRLNGEADLDFADLADEEVDDGFCFVGTEDEQECRSSVDDDCEGNPAVFDSLELCEAYIEAGRIGDQSAAGEDEQSGPFSDIIEPACVLEGVCVDPSADNCVNGVIFPDSAVCQALYEKGPSALCAACGENCSEVTCATLGKCAFIGGSCVPEGA
jgi:hypothetical protein